MIKNYLKEINNLRNYCNNLEAVIFNLNFKLDSLPDPIPVLNDCLDISSYQDIATKKWKSEMFSN